MKMVIFDLDDTLVKYVCGKFFVPKQTYHVLRLLKRNDFKITIVSYNPYAKIIASLCNLYQYTDRVICKGRYREELVFQLILDSNDSFFYFDDRNDNFEAIQKNFPNAVCLHVVDCFVLCKLVKQHIFLK